MSAGVASLEGGEEWHGLDDPKLDPVLAYPSGDPMHLERVRRDLRRVGVEGIMSFGGNSIGSFWVLGKGWVGVVCLGSIGGRRVALKVRRADADRPNMLNEARMHAHANSVGVGPRLLGHTESVLVMDYVNGLPIIRWIDVPSGQEAGEVRGMVSDLLDQCFRLDMAGLDHGELSNSKRHVLVERGGRATIIDFESASASRTVRNVVAMTGYLFCKGAVGNTMRRYFEWDEFRLRRCLREYKESRSAENYEGLRETVGLGRSRL
ncbi:MAG TPA: hypothetical protein P5290_03895 [Candidatus Methanomethylicus sp.]|nr:hypothetical protein [Candidatus Methanomethylicus sp.]